jgi:hypothetical protein
VKGKNVFVYKERNAQKICNTYERLIMCSQTDTQPDAISITSFTITCCIEKTEIAYRTEARSGYVNIIAVTSVHNPHCTLTGLHMTLSSVAIGGIPFFYDLSFLL